MRHYSAGGTGVSTRTVGKCGTNTLVRQTSPLATAASGMPAGQGGRKLHFIINGYARMRDLPTSSSHEDERLLQRLRNRRLRQWRHDLVPGVVRMQTIIRQFLFQQPPVINQR
jgi:hypothetical protein